MNDEDERARDIIELEAQLNDALELLRCAALGDMSHDVDFVADVEDLISECGQSL